MCRGHPGSKARVVLDPLSDGPETISEPSGVKEKCFKDDSDNSHSTSLKACHKGAEAGGGIR